MVMSVCSQLVCESLFQPLYLRNEWAYFDKTHHSYSLQGLRDIDDIKVIGPKVKVIQRM